VGRPEDIGPALEALKSGGAQALHVIGGSYIYQGRKTVADLALQHRLPAIFFSSDYVRAGGLVSYGTDLRAQ
jgi:putative ABC transport system substrate-binding protein